MIRFVHSADWQLGAVFRQFGACADSLRNARLTTLRRALEETRKLGIGHFLIAGDLFEDNFVSTDLVAQTLQIFADFPEVMIWILPGNHDPISGPESVWNRQPFLQAPSHVRILREAGCTDLGDAVLLASPLSQKLSTTDPSQKLVGLAQDVPGARIKIGITHGAPAIEGKHQPNDFPIALDAASRAGLDYLALGHWHNWLADLDGGRMVMPGTPEPDQFANERSGQVAVVEIDGPGQMPRVRPLAVATLDWKVLDYDFLSANSSRASLDQTLADLQDHAGETLLRIALSGSASPQAVATLQSELEPVLSRFFFSQVVDKTRVALGAAELSDLKSRHPILAQVLADIDQLERFATATGTASQVPESTSDPLTLAEACALLDSSKIELTALSPGFFRHLRQMLFQTFQEVTE